MQDVQNDVSFKRGVLIGRINSIGFRLQNEATLNSLSQAIIKSSEIEGEFLNPEQVPSSIARRLNIDYKTASKDSHYIDGVVDMMFDTARRFGYH